MKEPEQKKKAEKAIDRAEKVNYMQGTEGWGIIAKAIEDEIGWAFDKSVAPGFREEVKEKAEVYFEHYGYVNGLKQVEAIVKKVMRTAEVARKDIDKWESRKSQRS